MLDFLPYAAAALLVLGFAFLACLLWG